MSPYERDRAILRDFGVSLAAQEMGGAYDAPYGSGM